MQSENHPSRSAPWQLSLDEIARATQGKLVKKADVDFVSGVVTDSRKACGGALFVALRGANFDAHDFLPKAVASGAQALLIDRLDDQVLALPVAVIQVADTLRGLQQLAQFWRRRNPARILAVTGTNGKTTTKDFTQRILSARYQVSASQGSLNNHWGVPLSLLAVAPHHEVAIIEMGMNHAGEIQQLVTIAEPDVVGVTMVGRGHLEGMGSIEAVAAAKEEIYRYASPTATKIFNLDNPHTVAMYEHYRQVATSNGLITFSQDPKRGAQVSLQAAQMSLHGMQVKGHIQRVPVDVQVPVFGKQNITNLMMAACLSLAAQMPAVEVAAALPRCQTSWGRNQLLSLSSGAQVLFDAYNANPESMAALLTNLAELNWVGEKIAVLGEMRELGATSADLHFELGERAAQVGFSHIWFVGPHGGSFAAGLRAGGFNNNLLVSDIYEESLAQKMASVIGNQDIVAVKGSRGVGLERFLEVLAPPNYQAKS